jgi:hypothetical protein
MTIEATLTAGMSGVLVRALLVAFLARRRLDGRCLVGVMAIVARDVSVLNERSEGPLLPAVAIDARGRRARRKRVACQAIGFRGAAAVRMSRFLLVTTRTNRHTRILETGALGVMAVFTSDGAAPYVMLMTPAGSIFRPRGRHSDRNDRHRSSRKNAEKTRHTGGREHQHACQDG